MELENLEKRHEHVLRKLTLAIIERGKATADAELARSDAKTWRTLAIMGAVVAFAAGVYIGTVIGAH
jgi:hypothetical protein